MSIFDNIPGYSNCREWSAYTCVKCSAAIVGYSNYLDHTCKPTNGKGVKDKPINNNDAKLMDIN
jgi:hypothetical protein